MEEKIYLIQNIKFKLRPAMDYDIDESEELSRLQKILFSPSKNVISGEFTGNDMEKFLKIVLIPADDKPLSEEFNFRKAKEEVQVAVWQNFLLERIKRGANMSEDFINSTEQQLKH